MKGKCPFPEMNAQPLAMTPNGLIFQSNLIAITAGSQIMNLEHELEVTSFRPVMVFNLVPGQI